MFEVKVISDFSSAHSLREYRGKCEELHGHNWKVEALATFPSLDSTGMVIDFKAFKQALNSILEGLDHKHLNDLGYFKKVNPTSENIAKFIYDNLKKEIISLKSVTVWESENACATYYEK